MAATEFVQMKPDDEKLLEDFSRRSCEAEEDSKAGPRAEQRARSTPR